jgi:hypothetical protein
MALQSKDKVPTSARSEEPTYLREDVGLKESVNPHVGPLAPI